MKVSLSVLDRILVMNVLPAESNVITLRTIRKLKEQIGFTDEEQKALNFKTLENNNITWKLSASKDVEFDITDNPLSIIIEALKKTYKELDESNKMTDGHLDLYDKFIKE